MNTSVSYPSSSTRAGIGKFQIEVAINGLLLFMIFFFSFQKRFAGALKKISYAIIPTHVEIPSFFGKKMEFYLTDFIILAMFGWCLYRYRGALRQFLWGGSTKFLILFFFAALLSIICSLTAGYAIQYYRLAQMLLFFLFFSALTGLLEAHQGEKLVKRCLGVFVVAMLIQCAIGTTQYFLQKPLGLKSFGEVNITAFHFPMEGGYRWIFDQWANVITDRTLLCRCSGTFTHPNIMGGFLFASILSTYYLIVVEKNKLIRRLLYGAIFVQVFVLSITFSRAAIIATALGSCIWFGISVQKFVKERSWKNVWADPMMMRRTRALTVVVGSGLICFFLFFNQFFYRGGIVNYNQVVSSADKERIVYQNIAWEMFKDYPITGGGFNNYQILSPNYVPEKYVEACFAKVHNIYLLILAETGVLGTVAFAAFLISLFKRVLIRAQHEVTRIAMSIFIGLLFIGLCDFYLVHTHHGKYLFFLFAALLNAEFAIGRSRKSTAHLNEQAVETEFSI